jgi:hypothetical protein
MVATRSEGTEETKTEAQARSIRIQSTPILVLEFSFDPGGVGTFTPADEMSMSSSSAMTSSRYSTFILILAASELNLSFSGEFTYARIFGFSVCVDGDQSPVART